MAPPHNFNVCRNIVNCSISGTFPQKNRKIIHLINKDTVSMRNSKQRSGANQHINENSPFLKFSMNNTKIKLIRLWVCVVKGEVCNFQQLQLQ